MLRELGNHSQLVHFLFIRYNLKWIEKWWRRRGYNEIIQWEMIVLKILKRLLRGVILFREKARTRVVFIKRREDIVRRAERNR